MNAIFHITMHISTYYYVHFTRLVIRVMLAKHAIDRLATRVRVWNVSAGLLAERRSEIVSYMGAEHENASSQCRFT